MALEGGEATDPHSGPGTWARERQGLCMRYIDDISVFPRSLCSKELITVIPVPIHLTFPTFRLILKIGFYVITEVELGKLNILILNFCVCERERQERG